MRALILAAGSGLRMRPLTERTPKPLLEVGGRRLIEWHLHKLAALGIREVMINTGRRGEEFPRALGDGERYGLHIAYSHEGEQPLETGGGILQALSQLDHSPFIAVNADVWTDYAYERLPREPDGLAHLVLVPNPPHHPGGDFVLDADRVRASGAPQLTFAGIGVYRPALWDDWRAVIGPTPGAALEPPHFQLAPLLRAAMARGQVSGELHRGRWCDVGTPERLRTLEAELAALHGATNA